MALKDSDPNIRTLAVRLARQSSVPLLRFLNKYLQIRLRGRMECAISLTHLHGEAKAEFGQPWLNFMWLGTAGLLKL